MTKTILIAGSSLGCGHTQAARNLTRAILQNQSSWNVEEVDILDFLPRSLGWITRQGWSFASSHVGGPYSRFYRNSVNHTLTELGVGKLAEYATRRMLQTLQQPPDVFVATHSFAVPIGSLLKERFGCRLCVVTTDFILHQMHLLPNVDFICVPPAYESRINRQKVASYGTVLVDTGIPIATEFVVQKDSVALKQNLGLSTELTTVLVSFGGSGLRAEGHVEMFSALLNSHLPLQFVVLAGHNERFARAMRQRYNTAKLKARIKVYDFTEAVSDFYAVADIFLGKPGGLSVSEALASGLPIIIVDLLPGQEESNLRVLTSEGLAAFLPNAVQLKGHIESLLNSTHGGVKTLNDFARPLSSQTVANCVASLTT